MGILLSRFRKKKTTIEILEDLDTKIKEIQRYGQTTEQRHKKIVGTLIIYSVVLYILAALVFYFYFFPASLRDRFFYITPLLIFPLLIILTKRMVTWYYNRKISRNQDKLSTMQEQKKKILDDVTETETYKKAKEILLKFAPDQLRMTPLSPQVNRSAVAESLLRASTPQVVVAPLPGASELRRRAVTISNSLANVQTGTPANSGLVPVGLAPAQMPLRQIPFQTGVKSLNASLISPRSPLPRPILPQQRSYLDRLVEYLVGDGPSNRYALICSVCDSHNGMALKEEFEYFGFRCCYCNFWNPARKQKPSAPKLEHDHNSSFSSSLQSPKISELNAFSASSTSSSSVKSRSENLNNPISPCTEVQMRVDESSPEPSIPFTVKPPEAISLDAKRRRRTIYQLKPYEPSDVYEECTSETISSSPRRSPNATLSKSPGSVPGVTFSLQDSPTDETCPANHSKSILRCPKCPKSSNSDIEVVEKPSDNSDNEGEKESVAGTQKSEDKSSSSVEEKLTETKEDSSVPTEERKEADAQSEEMEVDESPMK